MIIIKKENIFDLFNAQHSATESAVLPDSDVVPATDPDVVQTNEPETVIPEEVQHDPAPLDEVQPPIESEVNEDV